MDERVINQGSAIAVGVSLALHAVVAVVVHTRPVEPPPQRTAAALTWVDVAPASPPAPSVQPPPPPVRLVRPVTAPRAAQASAPPSTPAITTPGGLTSDLPTASPSERAEGPTVEPGKRPNLTPGMGFVMRLPQAGDAEDTRGTTLRNDPMDQPDPRAVAEYEGERAGRKLSLDLATDVARAAQGAGRKPGFFVRLGAALGDASETTKVSVSNASQAAATRNAIGSVLDPTRTRPSDEATRRVAETAFAQNARIGNPALPGDQQQFNNAVAQSMTRFESIKENLSQAQLRAVVELTIDPTGALADASVLEKSGDSQFDESALHLSRKVMRALPESDEKGLGTTWWRSRWVFTWEPPRMKVRFLDATPMPAPL
ncbi:MAG: energy transducer TonB [Myxococcaceae bacterium]|nr:energy transducer TonB [Myxococcaceae bacterium]